MTYIAGTDGYLPPEVIQFKSTPSINLAYDPKKVDVFTMGEVLFFIAFGQPPFKKATCDDAYYSLIMQGKYNKFFTVHSATKGIGEINEDLKRVIIMCLLPFPEDRASINDLMTCRFVSDQNIKFTNVIR